MLMQSTLLIRKTNWNNQIPNVVQMVEVIWFISPVCVKLYKLAFTSMVYVWHNSVARYFLLKIWLNSHKANGNPPKAHNFSAEEMERGACSLISTLHLATKMVEQWRKEDMTLGMK